MEKNGTLASPAMARASSVLPVPGGADQQHAFRNAAAQLLELLRLAQEFDDLLQLFLGFFHARDVFKRDLALLRGMQAGAALAEAQRLVAAALHLAHHEDPEPDQQNERGEELAEIQRPVRLRVALS
jgi:hypothetical protein